MILRQPVPQTVWEAVRYWQKIEVFVIFVLSALSFAQLLFRLHKLNALDPLDHLVAKLILDAQPQRSAIYFRERATVHARSEQTFALQNILKALRIVKIGRASCRERV